MGALMRAKNWADTPLGPPETWPQSLKTVVRILLGSRYAMWMGWGEDLSFFYNDAYRPILGDKHPAALGRALREVWWEVYPELGPLNEAILRAERDAFFAEDHPWIVRRQGSIFEDARFTISYSPIPDETSPNGIGGILTTCVETT